MNQSKVRHLFIITYPRTGSTTLLRVVNTASDHTIRGESIGIINNFYRIFRDISNLISEVPKLMPEVPVGSDLSPIQGIDLVTLPNMEDSIVNFFHDIILQPGEGTIVSGWKETMINPARDGAEFSTEVLLFMARIFPDSKFIFNVRNPLDVSRSSFWKYSDDSINEIAQCRDWLLDVAESELLGPNKVLVVDHDIWSGNPKYLIDSLHGFGVKVNEEQTKLILSERLTHLSYI
jgi:hypothetical protein